MALCDVCEALDLKHTKHGESQLGEYSHILSQADGGCEGCKFFTGILKRSPSWNTRLSELPGHVVFLASQRLDVREPDKLDTRTYSADDKLFDVCVSEDYKGVLSSLGLTKYCC